MTRYVIAKDTNGIEFFVDAENNIYLVQKTDFGQYFVTLEHKIIHGYGNIEVTNYVALYNEDHTYNSSYGESLAWIGNDLVKSESVEFKGDLEEFQSMLTHYIDNTNTDQNREVRYIKDEGAVFSLPNEAEFAIEKTGEDDGYYSIIAPSTPHGFSDFTAHITPDGNSIKLDSVLTPLGYEDLNYEGSDIPKQDIATWFSTIWQILYTHCSDTAIDNGDFQNANIEVHTLGSSIYQIIATHDDARITIFNVFCDYITTTLLSVERDDAEVEISDFNGIFFEYIMPHFASYVMEQLSDEYMMQLDIEPELQFGNISDEEEYPMMSGDSDSGNDM